MEIRKAPAALVRDGRFVACLAVDQFGLLVEDLRARRDELLVLLDRRRREEARLAAVLEGQPDAVLPLDRPTHRVTGSEAQQLTPCLVIRGDGAVFGRRRPAL